MPFILIDIPDDIDEELKHQKIDMGFDTKEKTIIDILRRGRWPKLRERAC